jgi:hypothetical protein
MELVLPERRGLLGRGELPDFGNEPEHRPPKFRKLPRRVVSCKND